MCHAQVLVRQHPLVGERILRASPAFRNVATIVRSTHERWDGGGYPDGLVGEEIPLASRIISVSEDRMMKVWDIESQREVITVVGFGETDYVAHAPNGCYTGSGGIEARLAIFDGKSVLPLTNDARSVLFMPDGLQ